MHLQINKLLFLYSRTHKTKKPFSIQEGLFKNIIRISIIPEHHIAPRIHFPWFAGYRLFLVPENI